MTLQVYEQNTVGEAYFNDEQLSIITNHICKGASKDELGYFLQVCKRTGLDPFSRQIYSVPRGGQRTIQVGIDGLCLIADRTGRYMPGKESSFSFDKKEQLYSCTAYIKKQARDGSWHEVSAVAFWEEYNAAQGLWKKMPKRMLEKCALALCLRKAFPADLSGLYTEDEMHQADAKPINYTPPENTIQTQNNDKIVGHVIIETVYVTAAQAIELKEIHDRCEPAFREKVLAQLKALGITQWAKVPVTMFDALQRSAIANYEAYQAAVDAELGNVNE